MGATDGQAGRVAGWPPYLGHLRPQVDLLQIDGVWPKVVEQLAEQDSIAEGLRQVEHLRRVPGHPMVGGQHFAVDEPLSALLPRFHVRRLRDPARPGRAATPRWPPRSVSAQPTPVAPGAPGSLCLSGAGAAAGGSGTPCGTRLGFPPGCAAARPPLQQRVPRAPGTPRPARLSTGFRLASPASRD